MNKMKIDIWSDIVCPFCYIGKRKLESALEQFEHKDKVEIEWHSYQLDPEAKPMPGMSVYDYLAQRKGASREWSVNAHNQLTQTAKAEGLTYNFENAVITNTYDAHRLIQLAKTHGLGDAAEEALFKAYFTDGRNLGDHNTLMQLGIDIGLRAVEVGEMLNSDAQADAVNKDIATAQEYNITGVPFFILDNKYAISGAQPAEVFLNGLNQAFAAMKDQ